MKSFNSLVWGPIHHTVSAFQTLCKSPAAHLRSQSFSCPEVLRLTRLQPFKKDSDLSIRDALECMILVTEQNLQVIKGSVPPSTSSALCCQLRMKEKGISTISSSVAGLWDVGNSRSYYTCYGCFWARNFMSHELEPSWKEESTYSVLYVL